MISSRVKLHLVARSDALDHRVQVGAIPARIDDRLRFCPAQGLLQRGATMLAQHRGETGGALELLAAAILDDLLVVGALPATLDPASDAMPPSPGGTG
jgi:hypothetical protein